MKNSLKIPLKVKKNKCKIKIKNIVDTVTGTIVLFEQGIDRSYQIGGKFQLLQVTTKKP